MYTIVNSNPQCLTSEDSGISDKGIKKNGSRDEPIKLNYMILENIDRDEREVNASNCNICQ